MTPKERLKLIGWSIGYIVGGLLLAGLLVAPVMLVLPPGLGLGSLVIVQEVAMLAAFALLSWLVGGRILAFSPAEFQQLDPKTRLPARFGRFGWGAAVGVLLAVIAMLVAVPAVGAAWLTDQGGPLSWLAAVLVIAAALLSGFAITSTRPSGTWWIPWTSVRKYHRWKNAAAASA